MDIELKSKPAQYEAVIFDMDGVIINSKDHVEQFWLQKLADYGIDIPENEREERFHGRPARPTVNDLFAPLSKDEREEIIKECGEFDASVETYPMIPGVEQLLKKCSDNGVRMGLVTSALPGKVDRMLAGLSFSSPFEVMITANLVENGKPNPECYLLAAEKLDVDPETMIVFEDSVSGVKAASGAGATVVGINEDGLTKALLSEGAISVQPDLKEAKVVHESGRVYLYPNGKDEAGFSVSSGE
ncbi:HAD family hydrolase [Rhodohalobacter sulfatireducens]|uniref:HAD family phosphatase n=1 Tax=Rhodohalobacter sulfatireducens TaxID=2911366 RepID=A0ABS9K905_9BACT|nr:HAD family phosphatase [Rhodohalobacter sulfatireducens]MCG2587339.1 HAD family phosphatase [Rhodohalobacter sulfatireducens]